MTKLQTVTAPHLPSPGGDYCQAIIDGRYVYCSGVIATDQDGTLVGDSATIRAAVVLETLETVLKAAGIPLSRVVKSTVYVTDMADFADVNAVFARFFGEHKPARCTVAVLALPRGALVEIDAVARLN